MFDYKLQNEPKCDIIYQEGFIMTKINKALILVADKGQVYGLFKTSTHKPLSKI